LLGRVVKRNLDIVWILSPHNPYRDRFLNFIHKPDRRQALASPDLIMIKLFEHEEHEDHEGILMF
jgi:hypothetical protein